MGIVLKQSFINTISLFLGFTIGGINVLFLFTHFLHEDYFGLITFLLSTANILLPLMVFGMQHTIIKFYSSYKTNKEKDTFLIATLLLPLIVIIPTGIIGALFYDIIANWISTENQLIKKYTHLIFWTAIFMGYFEVFYAWTKVKFKSVFGNFIKEVFARVCTSILLAAVYFNLITNEEFIYAIVVVYALRALIMKLYAFYIYRPKITIGVPKNISELLSFSMYIIIAGSASGILLEIDKFMIPQIERIAEVAYYSVGIYIASVIAIPTRAMQQITSPITAQDMNNKNVENVAQLYKQTSINLLIIGGLLFLLINVNIYDMYQIINKPEFTKGVQIVFIISIAKLMELALGTANAILVNSRFYKIFFYVSIAMAVSVIGLNHWLISTIGINGAAIATLIVVVFYGFVKIWYIHNKLEFQPFTSNTLKLLFVVMVLLIVFYLLNINFNPFVNIVFKSVLIIFLYVIAINKFKISNDLNELFKKTINYK